MSVQDLIILRGRAASDVALHRSEDPEGKSFGRFRIAVPRARRRDDGEWEEGEAQFYTIKAWGSLAEHLALSIRRGHPVVVVGRPVAQAWINRVGEAQADLAIHAVSAGHDLVFGLSSFARLRRQSVEIEVEDVDGETAKVIEVSDNSIEDVSDPAAEAELEDDSAEKGAAAA